MNSLVALKLLPPSTHHLAFCQSHTRLVHFRNMSTAVNASGLTPSETKALKERSAQPHEEKIIQAIKEVLSPPFFHPVVQ